jgi:hypothetical protein
MLRFPDLPVGLEKGPDTLGRNFIPALSNASRIVFLAFPVWRAMSVRDNPFSYNSTKVWEIRAFSAPESSVFLCTCWCSGKV